MGIGLFGYGYPDLRTVLDKAIEDSLGRGRNTIPSGFPVAYFRRIVFIRNISEIMSFFVDAQFGDGIVLYINGREAMRLNLPDGDISHNTSAIYSKNFTTTTHSVSKDLFKEGPNIISVGLYQSFKSGPMKNDLDYVGDLEGRKHARLQLQLRCILEGQPGPERISSRDRIEMQYRYNNLQNDF